MKKKNIALITPGLYTKFLKMQEDKNEKLYIIWNFSGMILINLVIHELKHENLLDLSKKNLPSTQP